MWWAGLIIGFISSFHCVGMCGPIAMALPVGRGSGVSFVGGRLLYNLGRVTTYTTLGLAAGLLGRTLQLAGWQQVLSIASGLLMLLLVLLPKIPAENAGQWLGTHRWWNAVRKAMGKRFQNPSVGALFMVGVLNGLLPCGMVYFALAGAVSAPGVGGAMLYMALFGLGTLPLMWLVSLSGRLVQPRWRALMRNAVPYVAACLAVLFILRGLNLGVPYLSPKLVSTEQAAPVCHVP
ncbi:sulfite exporter TauE/SafE family protein [Rufibacter glacialis]|uniref:Sulfite exporter TauE/SafE family protein n=1 Tax=Rufibacter glacialis TaxID=1259555 RepID=A0A5M8QNN1_9BACT|nr:sulfite exporter TauE/SafE family protein [Rufibacter glacialis]KAA6437817.1 sulfite exporter TauE/SafE family protein [Rufibacter glacialis]GGK56031.1 membrane protein [Rufibacter glacialis]